MTAHPLPVDTRDEALDDAAQILVDACARRDALSPRAAAEAAYVPGGKSVDELERLIRERRTHAP